MDPDIYLDRIHANITRVVTNTTKEDFAEYIGCNVSIVERALEKSPLDLILVNELVTLKVLLEEKATLEKELIDLQNMSRGYVVQ